MRIGIRGKKNRMIRAERFFFPAVLLVFPLLHCNQGLDLSDASYSLANFQFFADTYTDWEAATYLANLAGWLLMHLPFGDTWLGMNLYTGLLVSAMALLGYYFLKGKMPAWIAFLGEIVAIALCWIPTTILYNYLTFFLFLMGSVFLYRGLVWERNRYLAAAGVCLGLNVMVRLPNVLECVLILAVFYYGYLKKKSPREIWRQVGWCVGGYLAGFLAGFLALGFQYGFDAYGRMLFGLSGYQGTDATYHPLSMVTSVLHAYASSLTWVLLLVIGALAGSVMFRLFPGRWERAKKGLFVLGLLVLLRLFWGRGMFDFHYYFYMSFFQWGMVLLYAAIGGCLWMLVSADTFRRDRLLSFLVLLIVAVTPIGSNNETYPNMNNLFLTAPVTFWIYYKMWIRMGGSSRYFPYRATAVFAGAVLLIQALGFDASYAFRDGIHGEDRSARISGSRKLAGMETREENAELLEGLLALAEEEDWMGTTPLLAMGDVPGLHYVLEMPWALSHGWPDLDTYPAAKMEEELDAMRESGRLPVLMIRPKAEEARSSAENRKYELLWQFMTENGYRETARVGECQVYTAG